MSSYRMKYKIGQTQYHIPVQEDITGFGSSVPVGTVLPFMGLTLPSGFLWCDGSAISRAMFPDLFTAIGTAFGDGDGATTFNLPKLDSGEFLEGASLAGTTHNPGLPNIEGEFYSSGGNAVVETYGILDYNGSPYDSGALYHGNTTYGYLTGVANTSSSTGKKLALDASRSSAVYGGSSTVQPKSLTTRYIIKAFDSQTNESSLIDVTQYAQALNGKSSKSLNDLTQTGEDHFYENDFTIIYPNNGTAENPANITNNVRCYSSNPFPGYRVHCVVEVYHQNMWGDTGWFTDSPSNAARSFGARASQVNDDSICVCTGYYGLLADNRYLGTPFTSTNTITSLPCRVKVWKIGKLPSQS